MNFPARRLRRLRTSEAMRQLNSDIYLTSSDLILPIFLDENLPQGSAKVREVSSMPGVSVHNTESALQLINQAKKTGIPAVILFGVPDHKDSIGSGGDKANAIVPTFAQKIKSEYQNDLVVIADLCLCEYTDHGHCGILTANGDVDNDKTLSRLADYTLQYAKTGIDIIAPSGMMDGMVQTIRQTLDTHDFSEVAILSYSVKYASAFYGPFRDAARSTPSFGDRKTYQMPYNRSWEAKAEATLDVAEGADILMVKPALPYLDVIQSLAAQFLLPIFAYQVSGEYSMIKLAGAQGLVDEKAIMLESLYAMKRAGSTAIITYAAIEVAQMLHST